MSFLKRWRELFLLVTLGLGLGGCDLADQFLKPIVQDHLAKAKLEQDKAIAALQVKISEFETENTELKKRVNLLEWSSEVATSMINAVDQRAATVTDEGKYGIARTPHGPVIVSVEKIQPYLDGYRVSLSIGNMTTASMNGAEIEVEWGLQYGGGVTYQQATASKKTKTFSQTGLFAAGAYTLVDVALTPAKPEEVKQLRVSPKWNIVSLRLPPTKP